MIDRLPIQQKEALLLVTSHQFSYRESASILGVSDSYLKILVFRARKALRDKEGKEADER
ncbi:sigma factor-like helix-turn-helix DNA-binding protein [Pseudalkalibacillus decolorationis]|uniref:sigma factor-like helix-turn-helix DNA-binding protein n=1 Tax=Pseudalkalibacillus decolorationis TaxID=163879 RepID=UPI003555F5C7